jgi:hypothetical protein
LGDILLWRKRKTLFSYTKKQKLPLRRYQFGYNSPGQDRVVQLFSYGKVLFPRLCMSTLAILTAPWAI